MIKFNRINGWSYKTTDGKFMISNCGPREWFSAEVDQAESEKFGWIIPLENSKQYHSSLKEAQWWVRSFNYKSAAALMPLNSGSISSMA